MAGVDGDQHEVEGSAGAPGGLAAKMLVVKVHTGAQDVDGGPVTALNPCPVGVGSGVVTSLNAATANTTSAVTNMVTMRAKGALQVVLTGAPTGGTVTLQGSLDGINFDAVNTLAVFTIGTDLSGAIKFVVDKPFIAFRTVLAGLAGGAAPTVTALVAAY